MSLSLDQPTRGARRLAGAAAVILFVGSGAPASASAVESDFASSCARYASSGGVLVAECAAQLQLARDATAKYRDPQVALRDGFVAGECVDAATEGDDPAFGAMGEHWIRVDRMADQRLDVREPEELLYIDTPRGRRLGGAEWQIAALEGGLPHYGTQPPDPGRTSPRPRMFGGQAFDGPMQGHNLTHGWPFEVHLTPQPWHYDLHVWLWEENPAGIFAHYNPRLTCNGGAAEGTAGADAVGAPSEARRREARLQLLVRPRTTRAGRRTRFRFRVTTGRQGSRRAVAEAVVRFAGRKAATDRRGQAVIVKELRRPGRHHARAVKRGMTTGRTSVRVLSRGAR